MRRWVGPGYSQSAVKLESSATHFYFLTIYLSERIVIEPAFIKVIFLLRNFHIGISI